MKSFALLVLAVVACTDDNEREEYPVAPGGDYGNMGNPPPGNGNVLRRRICVVEDLLNTSACRPDNREGFTVRIGGSSATTDEMGFFEVPQPTGSLLSFTVTGPTAVTTTTPYSPSATVPVIDADAYARTLASNQIFATPETGAILGNVVRGGQPAQGIGVTSTPLGSSAPLFDTDGPGFGPDRTGARGVFFVPGIATGTAGLTLTDGAAETTVAGISVINGGVTILDSVALP